MKRLTSLILALVLLITAAAVIPVNALGETFHEGDELFLKIESPSDWATYSDAQLYVNFTDATRAENNNSSIVIASADKSRYDPKEGVVYDSARDVYRYTVTAADEGKTVMRFWRGNSVKLWNESVAVTAQDHAAGRNTAVVTDWSDTGRLIGTYAYELNTKLTLSAEKGSVGDSFDITVTHDEAPGAQVSCQLFINDALVSDTGSYTFVPDADGIYTVKATVTAIKDGKTAASQTKTAAIRIGSSPAAATASDALYAHAVTGSNDCEAWIKWYKIDDVYWFFMPSSAKAFDSIELYSTLYADARLEETDVPAGTVSLFAAEQGKNYRLYIGSENNYKTVRFMFSSAEAALWVNNTDSFDGYRDFFAYLQASKENSVAATGAVSTPDGKLENADVKKMKGRGNTSWNADKKGFNVTLNSAITLAGMEKCKKFSLVSNFQDAAMARNRVLFDLADAVGVPYSSDSRFIDLYTNGEYRGTYQMCQKIDTGKNTLISGFSEDDYLDKATGGVKTDFCFVAEIDSSPAADDFHFTARNGNNLTMKAPDLTADDPNYNAVRTYIYNKYAEMCDHLQQADIDDYLDVNSLAKVYIINELGKNWDSGASSFYLTYQPDENGRYKFFASPVWDYDNSLGNARGVDYDLRQMGIDDYTLPTGWFASKKNGYIGPNILARSTSNPVVMAQVRRVWFEDYLPALEILNGEDISSGEIYSSDVYADILRDSAAMNYKIWDLITNADWICDHGSLTRYGATYTRNAYGQITGVSLSRLGSETYSQYTFDGQFDYMMDWLNSRAAWMSAQYIADYHPETPELLLGDVDFDEEVNIIDVTLIQRKDVDIIEFTALQELAGDVDGSGETDIIDATLIQRLLAGIITHF